MENPCLYEVFVLPITFKTVSFHHRSNYIMKFYPQTNGPVRSLAITPEFWSGGKFVDKQTGNIGGVGGQATKNGILTTERFPIDYNEQSVKFTTGLWLQVAVEDEQVLPIVIELCRVDLQRIKDGKVEHILNPQQKIVSEQMLYINLNLGATQDTYSYRKLIFPTCQYISFIDLACVASKVGQQIDFSKIHYDGECFIQQPSAINCCLLNQKPIDTEEFLRQIYIAAIVEKLHQYQHISRLLKEKIKQFKLRLRTSKFSLKPSRQWQEKWVWREVPNLRYVKVEERKVQAEGLFQSCLPINKDEPMELSWILCYHYNCEIDQLAAHIAEQSWLIQCNIRAVFQRCIQLMAILAEGAALEIAAREKSRVSDFLAITQQVKQQSAQQAIDDRQYAAFKEKITSKLRGLSNFSILQARQPLMIVSGQQKIGKRLDITHTVTILVHGFRGTEFDLSKLKSYLNLFHGFTHFYAVRSIATGEGTNASISKLGQLAGEEINKYLQLHSGIRYVNVVGFSLGGVIARSMLKHLKNHQKKFNLLLTLASPHLGVRQLDSCLVRAGLFYMRRVAKVQSIQDLNNQRTTDRSRFLQELAGSNLINMFNWVILVGSYEDQYVPSYSSLCNYQGVDEQIRQLCKAFNSQRNGVIRCNVKIQVKQSFMDMLTRRKTHISLLEEDSFIRMLVVRFGDYFKHSR